MAVTTRLPDLYNNNLSTHDIKHLLTGLLVHFPENVIQNAAIIQNKIQSTTNSSKAQKRFSKLITQLYQLFGVSYQNQISVEHKIKVTDLAKLYEQTSDVLSETTQQQIKLCIISSSIKWPKSRLESWSFPETQTDELIAGSPIQIFSKKYNRNLTAEILGAMTEDLIRKIHWKEFLNCNWSNSKTKTQATNIINSINLFNTISMFVVNDILIEKDITSRVEQIEEYIALASIADGNNQFELLASIISGLNHIAISRLKLTWSLVPKNVLVEFQELDKKVNPNDNYRGYRSTIKSKMEKKEKFCPILSVILRDLFAIYTSNPSMSGSLENLILLGKVLSPLTHLQLSSPAALSYTLQRNYHALQQKITFYSKVSDDKFQQLSYKHEPPANLTLLEDYEPLRRISETRAKMPFDLVSHLLRMKKSDRDKLLKLVPRNVILWKQSHIFVMLNSWGLPSELCASLVEDYILNGKMLLRFDKSVSFNYAVYGESYRILLRRKITALRRTFNETHSPKDYHLSAPNTPKKYPTVPPRSRSVTISF